MSTGANTLHAGTDVVVEGEAVRVTDDAVLAALATAWEDKYGAEWHFDAHDGAFHHEGGEAHVFRVEPARAYAFGKDPYSTPGTRSPERRVDASADVPSTARTLVDATRSDRVGEPADRRSSRPTCSATGVFDRRIVDRDASRPAVRARRRHADVRRSTMDDDVAWRERGTLTWNGQQPRGLPRPADRARGTAGGRCASTTGASSTRGSPGRPSCTRAAPTPTAASSPVGPGGDRLRVLWDVTGPDKDRRLFTRARENVVLTPRS